MRLQDVTNQLVQLGMCTPEVHVWTCDKTASRRPTNEWMIGRIGELLIEVGWLGRRIWNKMNDWRLSDHHFGELTNDELNGWIQPYVKMYECMSPF